MRLSENLFVVCWLANHVVRGVKRFIRSAVESRWHQKVSARFMHVLFILHANLFGFLIAFDIFFFSTSISTKLSPTSGSNDETTTRHAHVCRLVHSQVCLLEVLRVQF